MTYKCVICGYTMLGFGNNPAPIHDEGRCCGDCNTMYVIPARIERVFRTKGET